MIQTFDFGKSLGLHGKPCMPCCLPGVDTSAKTLLSYNVPLLLSNDEENGTYQAVSVPAEMAQSVWKDKYKFLVA